MASKFKILAIKYHTFAGLGSGMILNFVGLPDCQPHFNMQDVPFIVFLSTAIVRDTLAD